MLRSVHDQERSTFVVKNSGLYPSVVAESGDVPAVGLAGARLLTETIRVTSLDASLSKALSSWRGPWAVHDPGKIMADLAVCVALGGRCLSDVALLRCQGEVFGPVASDPTVCRLVGTLADYVEAVEAAVNRARKTVRQRVWALAGEHSPDRRCLGKPVAGDRRRRHPGQRPLRERGCGPDLQEGVRLPPADRVVRPRPRWRG